MTFAFVPSSPRTHIGLLRHFPVAQEFPRGWLRSAELDAWRRHYDAADAIVGRCDLGPTTWRVCISSDLSRAVTTARAVHTGVVEQTPLLREPQVAPFATGNLRLPVAVWRGLLRLAWMTGHSSQRACRDEFLTRVDAVASRLSAVDENTLVVSHAGMMSYLAAELRRRGFSGPPIRMARHAVVYLFEKVTPS